MKYLLALVLMLTAMPALAVDNSITAHCREGAPDSYSRPGGFCEAVANNKSLVSGPLGGSNPPPAP